jgi:hypothetical protein
MSAWRNVGDPKSLRSMAVGAEAKAADRFDQGSVL